MKYWKYIAGSVIALSFAACSDDVMDRINENRNDPKDVTAVNLIATVTTETAAGTVGTDIAWYASVFIEHNAGTYNQMFQADDRTGLNSSSLNNAWTAVYDNLMTLNDIIRKCSPGGTEPENKATLGIAQVLTAYNLAITTDMWGQVPFKEALKGMANFQPVYDKQQDNYQKVILPMLDNAITNLTQETPSGIIASLGKTDLIYKGSTDNWIKAAWSLKARYYLHLSNVVPDAADKALDCISKGFESAESEFLFNAYQRTATGENPWYQFFADRQYLSVSKTLYDLMDARKDPRMKAYFQPLSNGKIVPAPNGASEQTQTGYSVSLLSTTDNAAAQIAPTPLMTYHELKFVEAELKAKKGQDFKPALLDAIRASFAYYKVSGADDYYTSQVLPLLGTTPADNLKEVLTQKYISFYEAESIEAYNDYRRTRVPQLHNPNNNLAVYGFVERFPYPLSETSANSKNVPKVNFFKDKIWWAGGTE
ncbi:MAG TPA: SusD/RagB family nutrient-binding outer membrane lipoprotein [Chitinophaga sp.]|uniref:SusD/RagB family nutrient-binding outer membrane lipoprotein n=1 Tax=Chitinophaga sp. TaxID=1869181 RepID=UPI002C4F12BF|nr:SusD/RagB family nutrient-binding outer membrane lipoprotein [Chitinophaga sp.]HVI43567.1 SusD/RagB family nutrient-binding outer membrane lipoprotein [Chitinophaga sp.]